MSTDSTQNVTNGALGNPLSTESKVLETGAALAQVRIHQQPDPKSPPVAEADTRPPHQDFSPVKQICAHLNAFHVYASDPSRCVEANHYCTHLNEDVRQCLIYDTSLPNARLIGVEYMITPALYSTLSADERRLWHSHVFEVKSGMLIMPGPAALPNAVWEAAETKEMEQVVGLYGKTYHFWQVDRGDKVPLGEAQLMMSFTDMGQFPRFEDVVGDRDARFGVSWERKRGKRADIVEPECLEDWRDEGVMGAREERGYIEEPDVRLDADSVRKTGETKQ
ncbi:hypothetical protein MMC16_002665 [Acarospora aff. strigata]|nr:hypothetical protein [Acarospora aff. strigata]